MAQPEEDTTNEDGPARVFHRTRREQRGIGGRVQPDPRRGTKSQPGPRLSEPQFVRGDGASVCKASGAQFGGFLPTNHRSAASSPKAKRRVFCEQPSMVRCHLFTSKSPLNLKNEHNSANLSARSLPWGQDGTEPNVGERAARAVAGAKGATREVGAVAPEAAPIHAGGA
jgi:hypothetical protein